MLLYKENFQLLILASIHFMQPKCFARLTNVFLKR